MRFCSCCCCADSCEAYGRCLRLRRNQALTHTNSASVHGRLSVKHERRKRALMSFKRQARRGLHDQQVPMRSLFGVYMSSFPDVDTSPAALAALESKQAAAGQGALEASDTDTAAAAAGGVRVDAEATPVATAAVDAVAGAEAAAGSVAAGAVERGVTVRAAQEHTNMVTLPGAVFNRPVNPFVLYQVVRWQRAKRREVRFRELLGLVTLPQQTRSPRMLSAARARLHSRRDACLRSDEWPQSTFAEILQLGHHLTLRRAMLARSTEARCVAAAASRMHRKAQAARGRARYAHRTCAAAPSPLAPSHATSRSSSASTCVTLFLSM